MPGEASRVYEHSISKIESRTGSSCNSNVTNNINDKAIGTSSKATGVSTDSDISCSRSKVVVTVVIYLKLIKLLAEVVAVVSAAVGGAVPSTSVNYIYKKRKPTNL